MVRIITKQICLGAVHKICHAKFVDLAYALVKLYIVEYEVAVLKVVHNLLHYTNFNLLTDHLKH